MARARESEACFDRSGICFALTIFAGGCCNNWLLCVRVCSASGMTLDAERSGGALSVQADRAYSVPSGICSGK